jgi:hypothetical protein
VLRDFLLGALGTFNDFLERSLREAAALLGMSVRISRSSALEIPAQVRGSERVLAIAKTLAASRYVNLPGGRHLYDPQTFAREGIELAFLPEYHGPYVRMLHDLMTADPAAIRQDVLQLVPEPAR